jgi:hypothetical protein
MSILNSILGQVSGDATVQNLASKVGLSPEQAEQAIAALGQAHAQEGDTVQTQRRTPDCPPTSSRKLCSISAARGRSVSSRPFSRPRVARPQCWEG